MGGMIDRPAKRPMFERMYVAKSKRSRKNLHVKSPGRRNLAAWPSPAPMFLSLSPTTVPGFGGWRQLGRDPEPPRTFPLWLLLFRRNTVDAPRRMAPFTLFVDEGHSRMVAFALNSVSVSQSLSMLAMCFGGNGHRSKPTQP